MSTVPANAAGVVAGYLPSQYEQILIDFSKKKVSNIFKFSSRVFWSQDFGKKRVYRSETETEAWCNYLSDITTD